MREYGLLYAAHHVMCRLPDWLCLSMNDVGVLEYRCIGYCLIGRGSDAARRNICILTNGQRYMISYLLAYVLTCLHTCVSSYHSEVEVVNIPTEVLGFVAMLPPPMEYRGPPVHVDRLMDLLVCVVTDDVIPRRYQK